MRYLLINLFITVSLSASGQWTTNGSNINNSNPGNVGIGTSSPQAKLEVAGPTKVNGGRLTVTGTIPNDNSVGFWNLSTTGYGLYSQGGAGGRYAFHFLNQEGVSILYGKGNGNVGIGTYSPDSKLTVKGGIHAEEVKVDLNVPAPDYVFEVDYNLISLAELKKYISENKHLPQVPSAAEIARDGINLGEMNMLLLKKVEELTLHLIEQDRINAEQGKEIDALKNKLK